MRTVRYRKIPVADAERLVATVWCLLEDHGLATPNLAVEPRGGTVVDLSVTFRCSDEAELVRRGLDLFLSSGPPLERLRLIRPEAYYVN